MIVGDVKLNNRNDIKSLLFRSNEKEILCINKKIKSFLYSVV